MCTEITYYCKTGREFINNGYKACPKEGTRGHHTRYKDDHTTKKCDECKQKEQNRLQSLSWTSMPRCWGPKVLTWLTPTSPLIRLWENSIVERKHLLGGLCLSKREAANGRGLTISCNSLGLIELVDNVLY